MSQLDHLLLRPQVLVAQSPGTQEEIGTLLLDTIGRILRDLNGDRAIVNRLSILAVEAMEAIWSQLEAGVVQSMQALQALVAPFLATFQDILGAVSENIAMTVAEVVGILIERLAQLADAITADALEATLKTIAVQIDSALRLSNGGIYALIADFVTHIVEGMTHNYRAGDLSNPALERYIIGNNIRKIAAYMGRFVEEKQFSLDLNYYIGQLMNLLRDAGWDEKLAQFKTFVDQAGSGLQAVTHLAGTFNIKFNADPSGPEDPVSWYATWFTNMHIVGKHVAVADRFNVTSEPWYNDIDFLNTPYDKLERIAHVSYLVGDFVEALVNGILSAAMRPRATSAFSAAFSLLKGIFTSAMGDSNSESWVDFYKYSATNLMDNVFTGFIGYFLGYAETNLRPCANCCYTFLAFMNNFGKFSLTANYTYLLREVLLTAYTLDNTTSNNTTKKNADRVMGLANAFGDLGTWLGASFSGRGGYGIHNAWGEMVGWWLLSLLPTVGFSLGALGIRNLKSNLSPPTEVWLGILLQNLVYGLLKFPVYWYICWDGNTEHGRSFGFAGHGPKETSPYLLPYPSGVERQIIQGNLGPWSHNQLNASIQFDQVYSWDFSHDFQDKILAIRAGRVGSITARQAVVENLQDDSHDDENHIYVIHDRELLPEHDRGLNGVVERSVAQYLHGAKNSVSFAFALYGVPSMRILGLPVRQGQIIMLAGNTGNSRFNHLHLNVQSPSKPNGTIPIVFRDCDEDHGVPRANRYYTSSNVELQPFASETYPVYPPLMESGTATNAGTNTLYLDNTSSPHDDWYKGCHILVNFTSTSGNPLSAYKRIVAYKSGDFKVTVDSDWEVIPRGTIIYQIGMKNRADASEMQKRFAYWGKYNGAMGPAGAFDSSQIAAFDDGAPAFKYAKLANYMTPPMSGAVITGAAIGTNSIIIPAQPNALVLAGMLGRFIVFNNGSNIVAYEEVLFYAPVPGSSPATATLNISGAFSVAITAGMTFRIGNLNFASSPSQVQEFGGAFHGFGPEGGPPANFPGGSKPFQYLSYKATW